jgi:TonB family protein
MQAPLGTTIVLGLALAAHSGFAPAAEAQQQYRPARYESGARPDLPPQTVGGGQAFVELTVSPSGDVTTVKPLRATPPFTDAIASAVSGWQFAAATGSDGTAAPKPVASKVLVAAHFRPPTLNTPTLGEMPKDVAQASPEMAFPIAFREPPYPPLAHMGGVVVIQALVDEAGKVREATPIGTAPPFDQAAVEAARLWVFRPARINGRPTATYVYLVFGFQEPITSRP